MRGTGLLLLFALVFKWVVFAGTHSLHITFTVQTGISSLPEGMSSTFFDKEYIAHYNSDNKTLIPIQNWVKEGLDVYWNDYTRLLSSQIENLLYDLHEAKQLVREKDVHTLQRRLSCRLLESGFRKVSDEYGYDGENFISLGQEHKYVADMPAAKTIVRRWNRHEKKKEGIMDKCVKWLKRIRNNGKHHLQRPVSPPEVSFLQKTPSSPVVCFATGFYPRAVNMSWQRNGEDVSQNVSVGETLPNDDGTFQKTVSLNVMPEEWKENQYSCVVQHESANETIRNLEEKEIKTNYGPQQRNRALILIPYFLFILVLSILAVLWISQHGCPCAVFAGLMDSTQSDKDVHTLQRRVSCRLHESSVRKVSDEYGYDGKNFISLDQNHEHVADVPAAKTIVKRWNRHEKTGEGIMDKCVKWLKRIRNNGKHHLQRPGCPCAVFAGLMDSTQSDKGAGNIYCRCSGFLGPLISALCSFLVISLRFCRLFVCQRFRR